MDINKLDKDASAKPLRLYIWLQRDQLLGVFYIIPERGTGNQMHKQHNPPKCINVDKAMP